MPIHSLADDQDRTASLSNGPLPNIVVCGSALGMSKTIVALMRAVIAAGSAAYKIGVFVRNRTQMNRARSAVNAAGMDALEPFERDEAPGRGVRGGTMHPIKDLDLKAVAVMVCDNVSFLRVRGEAVAGEVDLDEAYEAERNVSCVTRTCARVFISGVVPASEFLTDLRPVGARAGLAGS